MIAPDPAVHSQRQSSTKRSYASIGGATQHDVWDRRRLHRQAHLGSRPSRLRYSLAAEERERPAADATEEPPAAFGLGSRTAGAAAETGAGDGGAGGDGGGGGAASAGGSWRLREDLQAGEGSSSTGDGRRSLAGPAASQRTWGV